MRGLAAGRTNWEIAQELGLSLEGVKYHVSEIIGRYGVSSRDEAVAAWRQQESIGAKVRRSWAAILAVPSSTVAKVAAAGVAVAVVLAVALTLWPQGSGSAPVPQTFESPDDLLGAMATAGEEDILHVQSIRTFQESDGAPVLEFGHHDAYFDFGNGTARIDYTKGADLTTDTVESSTAWFSGQDFFERGPDDDAPREGFLEEQWRLCIDSLEFLPAVIACGLDSAPSNIVGAIPVLITTAEWDGKDARAIEYTSQAGTGATVVYRFYIDAATLLPLALVATGEDTNGNSMGTLTQEFATSRIDRDGAVQALLDPRAEGFLTPSERELEVLDDPRWRSHLYWLGREFDPGGEFPSFVLSDASDADGWYVPGERPVLLRLCYEGADVGGFYVELWEAAGWETFVELLGQQFLGAGPCLLAEEQVISGTPVTFLSGYRNEEPRDAPWTTPTVPGPASGCPSGYTWFMAVADYGDYVVTINAPVGLYSGPAEWWSPSREELEAFAAALRLRQPGQ